MPTSHVFLVVAFIVFLFAAIWPALPQSAQDIKINLTAIGLALATLAALMFVPRVGPG